MSSIVLLNRFVLGWEGIVALHISCVHVRPPPVYTEGVLYILIYTMSNLSESTYLEQITIIVIIGDILHSTSYSRGLRRVEKGSWYRQMKAFLTKIPTLLSLLRDLLKITPKQVLWLPHLSLYHAQSPEQTKVPWPILYYICKYSRVYTYKHMQGIPKRLIVHWIRSFSLLRSVQGQL